MCGRELPSILKRLTFSEGHSSVTLQWSALPRSCFEDISLRRPWAYNIFMGTGPPFSIFALVKSGYFAYTTHYSFLTLCMVKYDLTL